MTDIKKLCLVDRGEEGRKEAHSRRGVLGRELKQKEKQDEGDCVCVTCVRLALGL